MKDIRIFPGVELFELHDTHGFPLANALIEARKRGMGSDLIGFALAALKAGWSSLRVQAVLREAIFEADEIQPLPPDWMDGAPTLSMMQRGE